MTSRVSYKSLNLVVYISAIITIFPVVSVWSAPRILSSEPVNGGDAIKLVGVGFKSHSLDFEFVGGPDGHIEKASLGADSNFGKWVLPSDTIEVQKQIIVTSDRGKVWYANQVAGSGNYSGSIRYDLGREIAEHEKVYVSWYSKRRRNTGMGQWKIFRLSYENDIQDDGGELIWFEWSNGNGDIFSVRPETSPEGGGTVTLWGNTDQKNDAWYRSEISLITSNQGQKNGFVEMVRHDCVSKPEVINWSDEDDYEPKYPAVMTYNSGRRYRWFLWQNYRGNGLTAQEVWMDDLYIQVGTFARVELGNNKAFVDATRREVQRPVSWKDNEIVFNVNLGSFAQDDDLYVYVIDDAGVPSFGIPLDLVAAVSASTLNNPIPPSLELNN